MRKDSPKPRVERDLGIYGSFLEFPNFKIQDLSPLANRQQAFREDLDPRSSRFFYFWRGVENFLSAGQKL